MKNMLTTIQIHADVKQELDKFKENKESYEEVILKLIDYSEKEKKKQEKLLIEGCKEMAKDSLKTAKEWEAVDAEWPEWKE